VAAHKKLGTWSKIKVNNKKHKAIKTRIVFDIKYDAEGKMTRYKAHLVAQGFNQVPRSDFDETWAPAPNAATTRALFAVAEATGWEVHHFDVKTAFINAKLDKEMYFATVSSRRERSRCVVLTWRSTVQSRLGDCGASSSTRS